MEYYVLNGGIPHVEHKLSSSSACFRFAILRLDHIFGMLLVELRFGVDHLRLNPDAEIDAVLLSLFDETVYSLG